MDKVINILLDGKRGQLIHIQRLRDGDLASFNDHPKEIFLSHGVVTCGTQTRLLLTVPDNNELIMTKMLNSFTPMRVWR